MSEFKIDQIEDIEEIGNTTKNANEENLDENEKSKWISNKYTLIEQNKIENIVLDFLADTTVSKKSIEKFMKTMRRKYNIQPKKEEVLYFYRKMLAKDKIPDKFSQERGNLLRTCFKKKDVRETSGVMVFAILSSPYPETGEYCYFEKAEVNSFFVCNKSIIKNNQEIFNEKNIEVKIHPATGIIISINNKFNDSVNDIEIINDIAMIKPMLKNIKKSKVLKVGDNVCDLMNPMTGELRQNFSCPFNCYFCPSQPNMPKSYEDKEPAVARSLRNGWNPVLSMRERYLQYITNGMDVDKLEVIIKGGTWTSYNSYYRKQFCRDIFYAANTFWDDQLRLPKTLEEEQKINETATSHIIGITIETRPDYITDENLIEFRECGITRIELGFQHTNNKILKKVNRQHTVEDSIAGIAKLLSCGFKVDIHLMPGLPNSTFDIDMDMVNQVLTSNYFRADQLKWYPTIVTPYTVIKEWYDRPEGKNKYRPWIENIDQLIELTIYFKTMLKPWHRTNRIQRDFTKEFICGGSSKSNLGDMVKRRMEELGLKCDCIRCREVRNQIVNPSDINLVVRSFKSFSFNDLDCDNGDVATEYFISYETNNIKSSIILGFLRLRLDPNSGLNVFPELNDCAMIRELHVYGKMNKVHNEDNHIQHLGLGSKLVNEAKKIARDNGYKKISVISGVGVRNYYREKHGFKDGKHYLICDI